MARRLQILISHYKSIHNVQKKSSTLSSFQSAGQDVNSIIGLVNVADAAFGALGIADKDRQQVKKGLVIGALAIGLVMLIKKATR